MSKESKIKKKVKSQNAYNKYYKSMLVNGKPKPHTLSYAQWKAASPTEVSLSRAGVTRKKVSKLNRSK